jgi:PAS domain S-box-containing protein
MILFPYLELAASLFILLFSFHIYSRCHENRAARFFSRLALVAFFACIFEYSVRIAFTLDLAAALNRLSGFSWAMVFPLFAHFCLIFAHQDWKIKNPLRLFAFYLPAIIVSCLFLFTNLMFIRQDINPFGIAGQPAPAYWLFIIITLGYSLLGATKLLEVFIRSPQNVRKHQAFLVLVGSAIPVVLGLILDEILPLVQGYRIFPPVAIPGMAFMVFFIYLAMRKYALFCISPVFAAEAIIETMPDSLIVTTLEGKVILVNDEAHKLLNVPKEKVLGHDFSSLFIDKAKYQKLFNEVAVKNLEIERFEADIIDPLGEKFPALINANKIRDPLGSTLGIVYIIRDVRG